MKKNKKLHKYNVQLLKERLLFYSILIFLLIFVIGFFAWENNKSYSSNESSLFTGKIDTANYAANLIDNVYKEENIVMSPFNIKVALSILYNGSDNNTYSSFKKYFKNDLKTQNNIMLEKLSSIEILKSEKNEVVNYYEELLDELFTLKYNELNIDKIVKLDKTEKENLILLLKKINLLEEKMSNANDISLAKIKKYSITKDELKQKDDIITYNLENILDNYESYNIDTKIINYNRFLINKEVYKEDIKKDFNTILSSYDSKIEEFIPEEINEKVLSLNNEMKLMTDGNINRIVSHKDLNNNFVMLNSLYFNSEWEDNFKKQDIKEVEFYNNEGNVSIVQMMSEVNDMYLENNYAKGFIKNFLDNKYSFIGILPKKEGEFSLSSLNLDSLLGGKKKKKVLISIPKFNYQSTIDIKELFANNYKLKETFLTKANYSKISNDKINLSQIIQKVNFKIDEKGTVDSKVIKTKLENSIVLDLEEEIIFNRPFAYLVINNDTKDIMLVGKVVNL